MKQNLLFASLLLVFATACSHSSTKENVPHASTTPAAPQLTQIAEFKGAQVTGISSSDDGRLFANFPRWREGVPYSVVEVMPDGTSKPYPDASWNQWSGKPKKNQFTCVQSVVAHGGSLFVLDPSNPEMKGVVGTPKLYEFDLATNHLKHTWEFNHHVAPLKSYLNDLRVDDAAHKIYMTDSGLGAIVVLDMTTGKSRRLLDTDHSTKSEDVVLNIEGKPFLMNGQKPKLHSDGIAFSTTDNYLYYHALTGYHLYRVPAKALGDAKLKAPALAKQVEDLGKTPAPDGMIFDQKGNLYFADLEKNAVVYRTPQGEIKTLIADPRVKWADTFTIDRANNLIFTASHLEEAPPKTGVDQMSFQVYRVPLAQ